MHISKKDQDTLFRNYLREGDLQQLNPFDAKILRLLIGEGLSVENIVLRMYDDGNNPSRSGEYVREIELRITRLARRIKQIYKPVVKVDKEAAKSALIEEIKQANKSLADIEVVGLFWGIALQSLKDAGVENFGDVVKVGFRRLFRSPGLGLITLDEVERLLYLFGGRWND